MPLETEVKAKTILDYRVHETDTGSPDLQVAILTQRIRQLTDHPECQSPRPGVAAGSAGDGRPAPPAAQVHQPPDLSRYQQLIARLGLRR